MRTRHARPPDAQLALDLAAAEEPGVESPRLRLAPTLSDSDHRAIARHLVDMLREEDFGPADRRAAPVPDGALYVKAEQLMERYQVSMKFVRSHAVELGATRLCGAANSKLRYHLPTADTFIASHRKLTAAPRRTSNGRPPSRRSSTRNGVPLVPFT